MNEGRAGMYMLWYEPFKQGMEPSGRAFTRRRPFQASTMLLKATRGMVGVLTWLFSPEAWQS
eukprot:225969-Pelagomonas_calceolata.AAC.4